MTDTLDGTACGALRHRDFRLLLAGRLSSQIGNAVATVAMPFAVLDTLGSVIDVGLVLAAEGAALAVFLLVGGVVADRVPRRRVMVQADLARFLTQGVLAALVISDHITLWTFLALQVLSGAASAMFIPAVNAIQPQVVPRSDLQAANALRGLVIAITGILGPAVGGLALALVSPGWGLAWDALTFLLSAAFVSRVSVAGAVSATGQSVLGSFAEGWHEFRARRWLFSVTAQGALVQLTGLAPVAALGPVIFLTRGGARTWGLVLAAIGVGSLVGGLVSLRLTPRRPLLVIVAGTGAFLPLLVLLAARAPTPAVMVAGVLVGIEQALYWTYWQTTLHTRLPGAVLSRLSALDWLSAYAVQPIGLALAAPVAVAIGVPETLLICAVVLTLGTIATLLVPDVRALPTKNDRDV